ncbi:MAG: oligosaccharide flippase family protein [Proteobacteria bacterium]|nr:oligosaccharide flippase family protein [Pseudomonadota bacterium]
MSLARKTFIAASWNVGANAGARLIGVIGTLVITRFLDPNVMAEVTAASILIMSASLTTSFGLGKYYIVSPKSPEVAFHMTALSLFFASIAFASVFLLAEFLSDLFRVPTMTQYVPGMLLVGVMKRIGALPEQVLVKDLRFRRVGVATALGEVSYVASSVALAAHGFGGHAMVYGNILQAFVTALIVMTGVHWHEWMLPCRLRWQRISDMMRFGAPIGLAGTVAYASVTWDNLLFSRYFGSHEMGLYNLGYQLAAIPGKQIGEHAGVVILPSLAKIEAAQARKQAVLRTIGLMGILVFPLAIGLAAVAESVVVVLLPETWQGTAPLVTVLAAISVFQPISWTVQAFWTAQGRTRLLMIIQLAKIGLLAISIVATARFGPLWVCMAVGLTFAVNAAASMAICAIMDGISPKALVHNFFRPLAACGPMVLAVLGCRHGLRAIGIDIPILSLCLEIAAGALVYLPAAFAFAPAIARDFVELLRKAFSRTLSQ